MCEMSTDINVYYIQFQVKLDCKLRSTLNFSTNIK